MESAVVLWNRLWSYGIGCGPMQSDLTTSGTSVQYVLNSVLSYNAKKALLAHRHISNLSVVFLPITIMLFTPSPIIFTAMFQNAKPNLVEDDNEGEVNGGSCEGGQQARLGEQLILAG
jgi:hypothetical protein